MKSYDVFISHASEDKGSLVRPLAEALIAAGLRVWYDEHTLKLGDNLRRSIDVGLANSRYGVVVLSNDFLRGGWTNWELDGLVQRQVGGENVILPVWHGLTSDELREYSPSLANLVAANTNNGLPSVIRQILETVMGRQNGADSAVGRDSATKSGDGKTRPSRMYVDAGSRYSESTPVDEIIFEMERRLSSSDDDGTKQFVLENPLILKELSRSYNVVIQTNPDFLAQFGIDALVVSQPQGLLVSLLWIEGPNQSFFEPDGSWSDALARVVGSLMGFQHSPRFENLKSRVLDLVRASGDNFHEIFHFSSQRDVERRFAQGQFQVTYIALCGRQQSINEEWRRAFNENATHRPIIELRTYDYVMEELYEYCRRLKLTEPVILTTFRTKRAADMFFTLASDTVKHFERLVRERITAQLSATAQIRVISIQITVQSRDALPEEEKTTYADPGAFKLAISDDLPSEWRLGRRWWSSPTSYRRDISLAKLHATTVSFSYQTNDMNEDLELELVISGASYCIVSG